MLLLLLVGGLIDDAVRGGQQHGWLPHTGAADPIGVPADGDQRGDERSSAPARPRG